MRASIYARYSSENQREESIDDQIASCRRAAAARGWVVLEDHVYADAAHSGASHDRPALLQLLEAAKRQLFDVLFVDDLSRLSRSNLYLLVTLADLDYAGVRLVSVADSLDTADEGATFAIQVRGVFNQLSLSDLRAKTLRGQRGQKDRGFFVGERTYGFRSHPCGEVRVGPGGRTRAAGYHMHIHPPEAAVVLRIFEEYAAGVPITRIIVSLNRDGVPHPKPRASGWGPSTVHGILQNLKYTGVWTWNRTGKRRDPRTGRRHSFVKPASEHIVITDETLRIVPQPLWDAVQAQKAQVGKVWPGGKRRGFTADQGSRSEAYPNHLFDGMLRCSCCKQAICRVSGKGGGYYGCHGAARRVCDNRLMVSRRKLERIFLRELRCRLLDPAVIHYALTRLADEVAKLHGSVSDLRSRKQAELSAARGELNNLLAFVRRGHASDSVAAEIAKVEARVSRFEVELDALPADDAPSLPIPSEEWIAERVVELQALLERRTPKAASVLRRLFGKVHLEPVRPDAGRPYYLAHTALDVIALVDPSGPRGGPDGGSGSFRWWRRRESNPRPKVQHRGNLHAYPPLKCRSRRRRAAETAGSRAPMNLVVACRCRARRPARCMTPGSRPAGVVRTGALPD